MAHDFVEAQRTRFRNEVLQTADRLRAMADEIERIRFEDHRGRERQPVTIVGEVTHIVLWGVANLKLETIIGQAESLYDLRDYEAGQPK